MKVTSAKQNGLRHEYTVEIEADEIEKQLQAELQAVGKKAKVQGFRPGKVPMTLLKQRYGKEVMDSVLWESVNRSTRTLMTEKGVRPALQPDANIVSYEEGGPLIFSISVDAMPEVPTIPYDKITVPDYQFDLPENEIEEGLQRFLSSQKHFHPAPDGAKAKKGDMVKIDFTGKMNGEPFDGGKGKDFQLELGSGQFIPGFEDQLIGAKAGDEVLVKVTFPKEYHSEAMAGKKAEFDVTVHSVHEVHMPELSDEFAEHVGFESVTKMREAVAEHLKGDYLSVARTKAKKNLFDSLDEMVKFDIPEKMRTLEFDSIWKQLQEAKAKGDPSLEGKSDDVLRSEYEVIAERRVRLGIVLAEVGRENKLQVTKDELTKAVIDQARMYPGYEQKVFEFYQQNPQHVDELKGPIIEEKAVDFILSKVKRKEQKVTIDELIADENAEAGGDAEKKSAAKTKKAKK